MATFKALVASALEHVQTVLAEEFQQVLAGASELEARMLREAGEFEQKRQQLEERKAELEQEFAQRREELEEGFRRKAASLEQDTQRLEEEKVQMAKGTDPGDILTLNLGGERFVDVKRATLCQCEESLLGTMFSGRWDQWLDRDKAGRVLLDFNPALVMPLIDHLRARRCTSCGPVSRPTPPFGMEADFRRMLNHFGMEQYVFGSQAITLYEDWCWDWNKTCIGLCEDAQQEISDDRREAESAGSSPIFGSVEFETGRHIWAIKLLRGISACVGIGTRDTCPGMPQPYGKTALVYDCHWGSVRGALDMEGLEKVQCQDTIGVCLDIPAGNISFYKNGAHLANAALNALKGGGPYIPIMGLWGADRSKARLISTTSIE